MSEQDKTKINGLIDAVKKDPKDVKAQDTLCQILGKVIIDNAEMRLTVIFIVPMLFVLIVATVIAVQFSMFGALVFVIAVPSALFISLILAFYALKSSSRFVLQQHFEFAEGIDKSIERVMLVYLGSIVPLVALIFTGAIFTGGLVYVATRNAYIGGLVALGIFYSLPHIHNYVLRETFKRTIIPKVLQS